MADILSFMQHVVELGLKTLVNARCVTVAVYTVCYYDWITSLDEEVRLIYPSSWNSVKVTYLFCRYYPLAIAPVHVWGFVGDHEKHVCEAWFRVLYAFNIPTMMSAQFILMLRTYAFTGRQKVILTVLMTTFLGLLGIISWVICTQLILSPMFFTVQRTGCFAYSDQNMSDIVSLITSPMSMKSVVIPAYHLGLVSVVSTVFDVLNMFVVIGHCIQQRGILGPIGQSFLKQGIIVYVIMTTINAVMIGSFFSTPMMRQGLGSISAFAYILPSPLACRLVLMLRQKASPTETQIRSDCSRVVDEALELVPMRWSSSEQTLDGSAPASSPGVSSASTVECTASEWARRFQPEEEW